MGGLLHEQTTPLRRSAPVEAENDGVIEGRNAVTEALRAGVAIDKIFLMKGDTDPTLGHIASAAREKGIVVVDADRRKLDGMSAPIPTRGHRTGRRAGICHCGRHPEYCPGAGEPPSSWSATSSATHTIWAVIRTADAAGAHGVIIPKRRPPA